MTLAALDGAACSTAAPTESTRQNDGAAIVPLPSNLAGTNPKYIDVPPNGNTANTNVEVNFGCYGACGASCNVPDKVVDTFTFAQLVRGPNGMNVCQIGNYDIIAGNTHKFCRWHDECYRWCGRQYPGPDPGTPNVGSTGYNGCIRGGLGFAWQGGKAVITGTPIALPPTTCDAAAITDGSFVGRVANGPPGANGQPTPGFEWNMKMTRPRDWKDSDIPAFFIDAAGPMVSDGRIVFSWKTGETDIADTAANPGAAKCACDAANNAMIQKYRNVRVQNCAAANIVCVSQFEQACFHKENRGRANQFTDNVIVGGPNNPCATAKSFVWPAPARPMVGAGLAGNAKAQAVTRRIAVDASASPPIDSEDASSQVGDDAGNDDGGASGGMCVGAQPETDDSTWTGATSYTPDEDDDYDTGADVEPSADVTPCVSAQTCSSSLDKGLSGCASCGSQGATTGPANDLAAGATAANSCAGRCQTETTAEDSCLQTYTVADPCDAPIASTTATTASAAGPPAAPGATATTQ